MKNFIKLFAVCLVFFSYANSATNQLAEHYLNSFGKITKPQESAQAQTPNSSKKPEIRILSDYEKRETLFKDIYSIVNPEDNSSIIDFGLIKKMEFLCGGENSQATLMRSLNYTQTALGEAALIEILCNPTTDVAEIQRRQQIVKRLLEDEDLFNKINELLTKFKESEHLLFLYWDKSNQSTDKMFDSLYFRDLFNKFKLNKSNTALNITTKLTQLMLYGIIVGGAISPIYGINKIRNEGILNKFINPDMSALRDIILIEYSLMGPLFSFNSYTAINYITNPLLKIVHTKTIGLANCINSIEEIAELISADQTLVNICENISIKSDSKEVQNLIKELKASTFTGTPSAFFANTGRTLVANKVMINNKEAFLPSIKLLGKIDAYMSIAKLYKKYAKERVKYTFVNFVYTEKPYIKSDNFWNPFINSDVVVTNNVELGENKPLNVILTGPNTGGKSTVIKGLLIDILLAQTLGIAPADSLIMTPFTKINCYMNITDDLSAGTSLFKAEVLRAKTLINNIRNLKDKEFSFSVMDEMFSGTSPKEGEQAAFMFAQELAKSAKSICFIATHFPKLTELPEVDKGAFRNLRVAVIKQEDGSLKRPFKLEEGKSDLNIAMDLLNEEGIFTN